MKDLLTVVCICFCLVFISEAMQAQKTLQALRIDELVTIDGIFDEPCWQNAEKARDFITNEPTFGNAAKEETEFSIAYDDEAIYVSIFMEESNRDSIMTELTQRDDLGNTDYVGVILDTYGNGSDGFAFLVGASGVQYDAKIMNRGNDDSSWDAVWFSEIAIDSKGWYVEMKLPYAALRFPNKDVQEWTLNIQRVQAKNNTRSFWNPVDPQQSGIFNQSGKLQNIQNIKPPIRLNLSPYASAYAVRHHDAEANPVNSTGYTYNGGLDVKYGINDAFTLDMTLIPDFGQVESDDQVVNLSPFEIRFDEKRPFFTEGLEIFEKGDIFYSRRVGGDALRYYDVEDQLSATEEVIDNPLTPQLYNASKVSGRLNNGLGIGVFNAVEGSKHATIRDTETGNERTYQTHSLTNYNVTVFDQNLKNDSHIAFTNANVWRKGGEFYDANTSALDFSFKDNNQAYEFSGLYALSNQFFADSTGRGHSLELDFRKRSGNLNFWIEYDQTSPTYNPNDLGFLWRGNFRESEVGISYNQYKPFWRFNEASAWFEVESTRVIDPNESVGTFINFGTWAQTKGFWGINTWFNYVTERNDYWEPRTYGRYLIIPEVVEGGFWVGTDNRKAIRLSMNAWAYNVNEDGRHGFGVYVGPRFRLSNKFTVSFNSNFRKNFKDTGWVEDGENGEIYIGQRERTVIQNRLNVFYNFSSNVGLNARVRHYWFKANYESFHELTQEGLLTTTEFEGVPDFTEQYFNVDLTFNWRFAPGSDLIFNWKNSISSFHDSNDVNIRDWNYQDGLSQLNSLPTTNSISLKLVYFLDYYTMTQKLKK